MIEKKAKEQDIQASEPQVCLQFILEDQNLLSFKFVNEESFIARTWQNDAQIFIHFNREGKALTRLAYPLVSVQDFIIVNDHQIVILAKEQKDNFLLIWSFTSNQFSRIMIKKLIQADMGTGILFFKYSEIICYWSRSKQEKVQLTYFKLSEISSQTPFHQFVFQALQAKGVNRNRITKLNESSRLGFFYKSVDMGQIFCVNFYDLDLSKGTGNVGKFFVPLRSFLNIEKMDFLNCRVIDVWQPVPQLFYIQVETYIQNLNQYKRSPMKNFFQPQKYQRYHTLYHNLQSNQTRLAKINIPSPHRIQFINSIRQLDYTQKQRSSLSQNIHLLSLKEKTQKQAQLICVPIYYVEPDGENVQMMNNPIKKVWEDEFRWSSFVNDKMFKIEKIKQRQEITVYKFPSSWLAFSCGLKNIAVDMMSLSIQECSEDLLEIVYSLIE